MPLSRNLFLNSVFISSLGPRGPVVDADPLVQKRLRSEELVDS